MLLQVCTTDATSAPEPQPIYVTVTEGQWGPEPDAKAEPEPASEGGSFALKLHVSISDRHVSAYVDCDQAEYLGLAEVVVKLLEAA